MVANTGVRWWQRMAGKLLIGQLLLLVAFASLCGWIYYSAFYSYVPSAGETYRCATGESVALFFALLTTIYQFVLCSWQVGLVRRQPHQKKASAWSILSFAAAFLPAALLIYVFWIP
ncbi:hypothetical protein MUN81_09345 [Hymenobacter sp. 5317J-9]|uniref:hypothetical protein n=1 Tax=Hymenobacter sp. 5317J-9 TaxID=2932250 RepID=UPI001FD6CBB3|nr:hypothetical protein [Hymenobacter sp. 5317J-9]UOQ99683.1 hypothetical protein MUN81_09345 [Hymenobacter sp. 5317J-9]